MILNRSHILWAFAVALITAGCAVLYLANFHPRYLPFHVALPPIFGPVPPVRNTVGGTPLGLAFGTVALLIFLFASALGIRKKRRTWPIGHVKIWLKAHIWLTILTIPLVAFHCGFHRGGPMPTTLLVLYSIVMGSGFFGLALQQYLPRVMTRNLPREVVFEEIPYLRRRLMENALQLRSELRASERKPGELAAAAGGDPASLTMTARFTLAIPTADPEEASRNAIADFLDRDGLPYLHTKQTRGLRLADQKVSDDVFRLLRVDVSEDWSETVDELQQMVDDRRYLDLQVRLHHWLHAWLLIHVPISFALLVMTFWHAYITLIYL